jgi:hypothetical protein
MVIKKRVLLFSIIFIILFIAIILLALNLVEPNFYVKFTGKAIESPKIDVRQKELDIQSPENRTYNIRDKSDYFVDLNVSANFNVKTWKYDLIDVKHNTVINKGAVFMPPLRIKVNRWDNKLVLYALDEFGDYFNKSVEFFVSSLDSFPVIENLDENIYVCEGDSVEYRFSVYDPEEDKNEGPIEARIDPAELFYIAPDSQKMLEGRESVDFEINSPKINKEDVGGVDSGFKIYQRKITVNDGRYSSFNSTNIILLEINNPPKLEDIGAKTEVIGKDNNIFSYKINVLDIEDGGSESGNLKFNAYFSGKSLFDISPNGLINFEFNQDSIGMHNITICVSDNGIGAPDSRIEEFCKQDGSSQTACKNFSLTITKQNSPPTIESYAPIDFNINEQTRNKFHFNITSYDPEGTIPDVYWYVDDVLESYSPGMDLNGSFSDFEYKFGCDNLGSHSIRAKITDGLLNDALIWKINVSSLECGQAETRGDCEENWACASWGICQNLNRSLSSGILGYSDYLPIQDGCIANKWGELNCGFQIRGCLDNNKCNTSFNVPEGIRRCFYTESPSCEDDIKNCHSRDCEVLADCGGPCKPCYTCYDGTQNQGEEGIDCGGPCYIGCVGGDKPVLSSRSILRPFFIVIIPLFIIIIIFKIHKISKIRKEIKTVGDLVTFGNHK